MMTPWRPEKHWLSPHQNTDAAHALLVFCLYCMQYCLGPATNSYDTHLLKLQYEHGNTHCFFVQPPVFVTAVFVRSRKTAAWYCGVHFDKIRDVNMTNSCRFTSVQARNYQHFSILPFSTTQVLWIRAHTSASVYRKSIDDGAWCWTYCGRQCRRKHDCCTCIPLAPFCKRYDVSIVLFVIDVVSLLMSLICFHRRVSLLLGVDFIFTCQWGSDELCINWLLRVLAISVSNAEILPVKYLSSHYLQHDQPIMRFNSLRINY